MAHPYKRPVSLRASPLAIVGESAAIVNDTVRGRVSALLAESPADPTQPGTPMTVTVGGAGRSRVTGAPSAGQYAVSTVIVTGASGNPKAIWQPVLVFHSSDAGATASVSYHGIGTLHTPELEDALARILTPLVGVASDAVLAAAYPATTDETQPGRAGRLALLADDSLYYSTGSAWKRISGSVGGTVHTHQQTDSGAGTDARTTAQAHAEIDAGTGIGTDSASTTHTPATGSHVEDRTDSAAGDAAAVTQVARVVSGQDAGVGTDSATATQTGGAAAITSDFEADNGGWTPSNGFSRSYSSPIAGSWSMRDANSNNLAGNGTIPTLTRTVTGLRNAITSIVVKARGSFSGYTGHGEHMDVQVTDGSSVRATAALTADGTVKTITLTPTGFPASGGTLAVRVVVTGGYDESETGPNIDYDAALDDIVINGISA